MANRAPGFITNPNRKIYLAASPCRVRVKYGREWIADTIKGAIMYESDHLPVYYFPHADVRTDYLHRTTHSTYCQYKGEASYWSIRVAGKESYNAAWGYERPYDEMMRFNLQDYCAFYWDKVDHWYEDDDEVTAIQTRA